LAARQEFFLQGRSDGIGLNYSLLSSCRGESVERTYDRRDLSRTADSERLLCAQFHRMYPIHVMLGGEKGDANRDAGYGNCACPECNLCIGGKIALKNLGGL